jgi:cysteine desulfurase
VGALRDKLENQILTRFAGTRVNGLPPRLPNITNISFEGVDGESAVIALDLEGVAVSTGSACSSGALDPSPVLMAMGLRPEIVQGSLRFSLGYHNTDIEIERTLQILETVVQRLRKLSRR